MFALACLDGSGDLSPQSDMAWNIFGASDVEQKKQVAKTGFRTDISPKSDILYPECIFPEIPIADWVFCILHGGTRIAEKLLNLVVETITSEKYKLDELSCDLEGAGWIHNLEANMNLRGVRSGNFKIHFNEKSGKPKLVSLNKCCIRHHFSTTIWHGKTVPTSSW